MDTSEAVVLELERNEARLREEHTTAARLLVDLIGAEVLARYPTAEVTRFDRSVRVYVSDVGRDDTDDAVAAITIGRKDGMWSAEYVRWAGEDAPPSSGRRFTVAADDLGMVLRELLLMMTREERGPAERALGDVASP